MELLEPKMKEHLCFRLTSDTKKQGKVPRRIHKAEREKQKRDHMNVLFLELSKAIGNLILLWGLICMLCAQYVYDTLHQFSGYYTNVCSE